MGLTTVTVRVSRVGSKKHAVDETMLVDSGAIYAVVPSAVLRKLGVRPHGREKFSLADGSSVERAVGSAFFEVGDRRGAAPVIFGEPGDASLLGALALAALGLVLDPLRRELRPMKLWLAAAMLHSPESSTRSPVAMPCRAA
jgi:predicted aspartyl protease